MQASMSKELNKTTLNILRSNTWRVIGCFYEYDTELNTNTLGYDRTTEYMVYRLHNIETNSSNDYRTYRFVIDELVELIENYKINIVNLEILNDDIQTFKERHSEKLEQQFKDYENYRLKCDLLGVKYSDIRKEGNDYILYKLVPDENGVATVPDFVNKIDKNLKYKNSVYKYTKVIWKNPLVLSIDEFFYKNKHLVKLDLTEFNISKIPSMQGLFNNCTSLKEADFGNNDFHNVVDMRLAFYKCVKLTKLDLSRANFKRYVDLENFAGETYSLGVLNMNKARIYTEPTNARGRYAVDKYLIDYTSGNYHFKSYIILGSTSLAHITSWLSTYTIPNLKNRKIFVDELTGINFIKDFITTSEMLSMASDTYKWRNFFKEKETCDSPKEKYKEIINKDIVAMLIPDKTTVMSTEFSRVAVIEDLDGQINTPEASEFKYRLLIKSAYDKNSLFEVYFNKYTEWDL